MNTNMPAQRGDAPHVVLCTSRLSWKKEKEKKKQEKEKQVAAVRVKVLPEY